MNDASVPRGTNVGFMAHPSLHDGAVPHAFLTGMFPLFGTAGDPLSSLETAWRVLKTSAAGCMVQNPVKEGQDETTI